MARATEVFYCQFANKKQVLVEDLGTHLRYRFGKNLQQAELELQTNKAQAFTWQWKGVGRHYYYDLSVFNGKTRYRMFFSVDRLVENAPVDAGISVERGEQVLAHLSCQPQTVRQALEGISGIAEEE
ncbi:hypothetical protein [Allopseudospirillum japonicum]|nr:hypothetical protein [Allopseudospirillum japonicum]